MPNPMTLDQIVEQVAGRLEPKTVELIASIQEKHQKTVGEINDAHKAHLETLMADRVDMKELLSQVRSAPVVDNPKDKGLNAARYMRCFAAARGDPERATKIATAWFGADSPVAKALGTADVTTGGAMVPEGFVSEIIELLYPRTVIRGGGSRVIPMPNGQVRIPKVTAGSTFSYVGENNGPNATQPTTGEVLLIWKKLQGIIAMSKELLRFSSPTGDAWVRNDAVNGMAKTEDRAFIRGDGTQFTPRGLRFWAPAANISASNAANDASVPTIGEVENDFRDLMNALAGNDVPMISPRWLASPRTVNFLRFTRESNGNLAFPSLTGANPSLFGIPVSESNNILNNLASSNGGTSDATSGSELYLVDLDDTVIGEATPGGLEIEMSDEAAYTDASGTMKSAFKDDQTLIKITARHDFGVRRDVSVAVKTDILYGVR